jgi:hypothetical protein
MSTKNKKKKHDSHTSSSSSSSGSSSSESDEDDKPCAVHGPHGGKGPRRGPFGLGKHGPKSKGPFGKHGPHKCSCGKTSSAAPSTAQPTPTEPTTEAVTTQKPCFITDALHACDPFRLAVANNTGPLGNCPLVDDEYFLKQFEFCINNFCNNREAVCKIMREVGEACWIVEPSVDRKGWLLNSGCQLSAAATSGAPTPAPLPPSTGAPRRGGPKKNNGKKEQPKKPFWGKWWQELKEKVSGKKQ